MKQGLFTLYVLEGKIKNIDLHFYWSYFYLFIYLAIFCIKVQMKWYFEKQQDSQVGHNIGRITVYQRWMLDSIQSEIVATGPGTAVRHTNTNPS